MSTKPDAFTCRVTLMAACGCFLLGAVIAGLQLPGFALLVLAGLVARKRHFDRQNGGHAHGTARLADFRDLYENGLLGEGDALILGRAGYTAPPPRWYALRTLFSAPRSQSAFAVRLFLAAFFGRHWGHSAIIRLRRFVHLVTFAPTGRGKGVGVLVTNLLSYLGSCVVTDPKGELFGLTGEHRRGKFGHRVVRLDPFALGGPGSDTFNPFDLIEIDSPHLLDMCRDLANMLVVRTGKEHDPYWNDSAELILTAFIAFVAACERTPEHRNLQTVRDLVSSRDSYAKAVKAMQESDACGGMLRRFGQLLSWYVDRELGSVLTSVQRHTTFLDSPVVAANTARSSFDPRALRQVPMTVYLCLPHDRLVTLAPLQRMWIGCLLRAVALGGANEHNPVLFLLDEAGHLGHIEALEDAVTLMRGYGVRLWFFFQSVGQLTECFGERAGVFLDNIDTQQFFGINAMESADVISKRMGDATIRTESRQRGTSYSYSDGSGGGQPSPGQHSTSDSLTVSEMARRLFKPEEIIRQPEDLTIIFHRNLPPILGKLMKYYEAPEFRNGGTGSPRGLGRAAGVIAVACLLAGGWVVSVAANLPVPQPIPVRHYPARRVTGYRPYQRYRPSPLAPVFTPVTKPSLEGFSDD